MTKRKRATYYRVDWRGKITRDRGLEIEYAVSPDDARTQFQTRYPMRDVLSVIKLTPKTAREPTP